MLDDDSQDNKYLGVEFEVGDSLKQYTRGVEQIRLYLVNMIHTAPMRTLYLLLCSVACITWCWLSNFTLQ